MVVSVVVVVGVVLGGFVDYWIGFKLVIVGLLVVIIVVVFMLLMLLGLMVFWVCGLLLCVFIGLV